MWICLVFKYTLTLDMKMNKKYLILTIVLSGIVGGIIGFVIYSQLFARYDAVVTSCVITNQAVENNMLTAEQVKQLGYLTGKSLNTSHSSVASKLKLSDAQISNASKDSVCSQFLVGVNQASK